MQLRPIEDIGSLLLMPTSPNCRLGSCSYPGKLGHTSILMMGYCLQDFQELTANMLMRIQTLIWSGSQLYHTRPVVDFRLINYQGKQALSFIVTKAWRSEGHHPVSGVILDDTYSLIEELPSVVRNTELNIHEFRVNPYDSTAVFIYDEETVEASSPLDSGFAEIDIPTRELTFQWNASQHIVRNSSVRVQPAHDHGNWDWL